MFCGLFCTLYDNGHNITFFFTLRIWTPLLLGRLTHNDHSWVLTFILSFVIKAIKRQCQLWNCYYKNCILYSSSSSCFHFTWMIHLSERERQRFLSRPFRSNRFMPVRLIKHGQDDGLYRSAEVESSETHTITETHIFSRISVQHEITTDLIYFSSLTPHA